jgi:hypothetical protein
MQNRISFFFLHASKFLYSFNTNSILFIVLKYFRVLYVGLYFRAMGFFGLFACEHDRWKWDQIKLEIEVVGESTDFDLPTHGLCIYRGN